MWFQYRHLHRDFKTLERIFINNQIRARQVRLISKKGEQLGVFDLEKALGLAKEQGLDLVQVTHKIMPPVCKITEAGKYLYHQKKKQKFQKQIQLKNVRITFNISSHDLETKAGNAIKFLNEGDNVKIEMRLRGRENIFSNLAKEKIGKFLEIIKSKILVKTERELKREGRGFTTIIRKI